MPMAKIPSLSSPATAPLNGTGILPPSSPLRSLLLYATELSQSSALLLQLLPSPVLPSSTNAPSLGPLPPNAPFFPLPPFPPSCLLQPSASYRATLHLSMPRSPPPPLPPSLPPSPLQHPSHRASAPPLTGTRTLRPPCTAACGGSSSSSSSSSSAEHAFPENNK